MDAILSIPYMEMNSVSINSNTSMFLSQRKRLRMAFYCEVLFGIDQFSTATALLFFVTFRHFNYEDFFLYLSLIFATASLLEIPLSLLGPFFERKHLFLFGKALFILGFSLATFSETLPILLFSAVVTGIGQAVESRNFMSLMFESFKKLDELELHEIDVLKARAFALVFNAAVIVAGGFLGENALLYPMLADIALLWGSFLCALLLIPSFPVESNVGKLSLESLMMALKNSHVMLIGYFKKNYASLSTLLIFGISMAFLSRTSFSLYQPILSSDGWSIKSIGIIIAAACFIGGSLGLLMPRYLQGTRSLFFCAKRKIGQGAYSS